MKTDICEKLGIDVPVFAFTHCRDVVVEVCKAGGHTGEVTTMVLVPQVVGQMNQEKDCRSIMYELLEETATTVDRLHACLHEGEEE